MTDKPGMPGGGGGGGDDAGSIMALLERVAGLMDSVQATQQRMEERQLELENTVKTIQADVVKLTNDHANTSSTVDRLLEKTRKVSRHIKDVRVRVENQNIRVKKVEATQGDLLAKNKFRVVIYQVRLSRTDEPAFQSVQVQVLTAPQVDIRGDLQTQEEEPAAFSVDAEFRGFCCLMPSNVLRKKKYSCRTLEDEAVKRSNSTPQRNQ